MLTSKLKQLVHDRFHKVSRLKAIKNVTEETSYMYLMPELSVALLLKLSVYGSMRELLNKPSECIS